MAPTRTLRRRQPPPIQRTQQPPPARPGWTAQDRLQLAVRFAEADLAQFSDGDWLKLREDFEAYLGGAAVSLAALASLGGFLPMPDGDHPATVPRSWFEDLQRDVRPILRYVAGDRPTRIAAPIPGTGNLGGRVPVIPPRVPIAVTKNLLISDQNFWLFTVKGPSRDVILEQLFHLLGTESTDQIRLCPRPDCGAMFYRIRRQEYCSRNCVNKAYQDSPKGIAIRKRKYAEQGWKFGARTQKATTRATTKGPRRRTT